MPVVNVLVPKVHTALVPVTGVPVPSTIVPSLNVTTEPPVSDAIVGTAAPGATGVTVAVNTTGLPTITGLLDEMRRLVVAAGLTFCATVPVLVA